MQVVVSSTVCARARSPGLPWRRVLHVQDFFQKECWAHHPKPYTDFMKWRADEDARWAAESSRLIPGA